MQDLYDDDRNHITLSSGKGRQFLAAICFLAALAVAGAICLSWSVANAHSANEYLAKAQILSDTTENDFSALEEKQDDLGELLENQGVEIEGIKAQLASILETLQYMEDSFESNFEDIDIDSLVAPSNTDDSNTDTSLNDAESTGTPESLHSEIAEPIPATLTIGNSCINYIDAFLADRAPSGCAGIWLGNDDIADGSYCYFIGHNPGVFSCVTSLAVGDPVMVCNKSGDVANYYVVDAVLVPRDTTWENIQGLVTSYGESIILQTCDNDDVLIVVAAI